nr:PREDICTED: DNA repair protein RAD52 homolog isoform X1 [Megachile rotundata]
MNNVINYPSCIKIPPTNVKQSATITMSSQKFDIKEAITLNDELISLANKTFGERKWNHSVTSQTIDFVESFMGKYICGCVTFIKIQLQDGTFHEDIGYCHAEGAIKGLSIHCARIGSLVDAFKKTLSCFGNELANQIKKLSKKLTNSNTCNVEKEDLHLSIQSIPADLLEPCAQSTPLISNKNENTCKPITSVNEEKQSLTRPKSPVGQRGQTIIQHSSIPVKVENGVKDQLQSNDTNFQNEPEHKAQDSKKVLSEEELQRLERKRKQMEKQAEYKRLMREKEQQKLNENKKPNPKY